MNCCDICEDLFDGPVGDNICDECWEEIDILCDLEEVDPLTCIVEFGRN